MDRALMARALIVGALMATAAIGGALLAPPAHAAPRVVRVATLADGPGQGSEGLRAALQKQVIELVGDDREVVFPPELQVVADWTAAGIRQRVDALLSQPDYDVLVTLGGVGSHLAARAETLPKPVVAAAVLDADVQRLPRAGNTSGKANLTYITDRMDLARDFTTLREVVPFERLAVVTPPAVLETIPEIAFSALAQFKALGIEVLPIGIGTDPQSALAAIPADVDAVYLSYLPQLDDAAIKVLADGFIARKLPSAAYAGTAHVELGILMSGWAEANLEKYVRRVALAVQQIVIGEPASELPVLFEREEQLTLNMATARALGLSPRWKVLTEAELLHAEAPVAGPKLTLTGAVQEALQANRGLIAAEAAVTTGRYTARKANAPLLPTFELSATGSTIDADRAEAAMGSAPQHAGSVKLAATQLVYNDGAWANRTIQGHLQRQREAERDQTALDVAHDAAKAYLDVLRARTAARIQRDNLRVTRSNLSTARTRARIGAGRQVDIARWEAQIANDQQSVIAAEVQVDMALAVLNQALGRPLEAPAALDEAVFANPDMLTARPEVVTRLDNPRGFATFRRFMAREAVRRSPEIAQLDAALAAAERGASAARRTWLPTVALQAEVSHRFYAGGEGTEGLSLEPDPAALAMLDPQTLMALGALTESLSFPEADDTNWFVGLAVSLDLYDGGERYAAIGEADAQLAQLRRQREALVERIEQRVLLAVHAMGAAYPRIELAQESANAARKSLEASMDAYRRGVVDEVSLLDVQRTARAADDLAANAVFDFMAELMGVHRAVGAFFFLEAPEARADFIKRFIEFMDAPATAGQEGGR